MPDESFSFDVFLSHSSKDKAVVRPLAERLRKDGVTVWFDEWEIKPGDSIPSKIEEGLERSRVQVLCMSANASGSDWAQLESGTFRFRDPLNKERRFLPLRLDDAPSKASVAQYLHVNWAQEDSWHVYPRLLEACLPPAKSVVEEGTGAHEQISGQGFGLPHHEVIWAGAFSKDGGQFLGGSNDNNLRLWDVKKRRCIRAFKGHTFRISAVTWDADQRFALSAANDSTIRFWDVLTGECLHAFEGHTKPVRAVALSTDVRLALSGASDNTIRVWDTETGQCLRISVENDLGVLPLRSIAEGNLIYQSIGRDGAPMEMKRLPPAEERVVLGEMELQLMERKLCLRQGDKLVFPSHCGRDRPVVLEHPSVFVSYAVKGFLDDIYATLVVKLADSESFKLKELWREAADFMTLADDHHMGLKLTRESGSDGDISVYFGKGVTQQEQVIFANYIHAHLQDSCEEAQRLRHYVCPKCHAPKGNPEVLMKKLLREKQNADTECDGCGGRFPLWDALEKKFASESLRTQVEQLQADDMAKLTERRKGKLLVLDVGARITSANQKWIEIPGDEDDGIDLLMKFTDEAGNGIGSKGLCLQLKAGNSHLKKRKSDGAEIFTIKKQRWVKTWMNQAHPVMLVIGTFSEDDERTMGKDKLEFADVRWMEITSVLKRESSDGTKTVKQIEFKGERLDLSSVRKWRNKILSSDGQLK